MANRLIIPLVLAFCLFGCGKKEEEDPLMKAYNDAKKAEAELVAQASKLGADVLIKLDIQQIMARNGVAPLKLHLFDKFYVPVSDKFVFDIVAPATFRFLTKDGIPYKPEQNDCNTFSIGAQVIASREFYFTKQDKRNVQILFGEFHYVKEDGTSHSINVFIKPDKTLGFFEPQSSKIVFLSKEEISSCSFVRF
jgi:hypothetical protein